MGPPSPRDIFLNCILESQHMPTAGELLRKSTSTSFNIAHKVGQLNRASWICRCLIMGGPPSFV